MFLIRFCVNIIYREFLKLKSRIKISRTKLNLMVEIKLKKFALTIKLNFIYLPNSIKTNK